MNNLHSGVYIIETLIEGYNSFDVLFRFALYYLYTVVAHRSVRYFNVAEFTMRRETLIEGYNSFDVLFRFALYYLYTVVAYRSVRYFNVAEFTVRRETILYQFLFWNIGSLLLFINSPLMILKRINTISQGSDIFEGESEPSLSPKLQPKKAVKGTILEMTRKIFDVTKLLRKF